MTILCSDGYEYKDFAQRVLGQPLENVRNQQVVSYRFHKKPEGFIRAFCDAFDRERALRPEGYISRAREHGINAAYSWNNLNCAPRYAPNQPSP